jgi:hypothetical protein
VPVSLPNTTVADTFPPASGGAQLAGNDIFTTGWFTVANNAAIAEYEYGYFGASKFSPEIFLAPGTYPISVSDPAQALMGIRFRNAVAGKAAQVWGALFYPKDVVLASSSEFTSIVAAGGGITPPASGLNITANYVHGPVAPGVLVSIGAPAAGTYIVGFGAGTWNSGGLGDKGTITSNVTGTAQTVLATTAGSGNGVWVQGIVLTNGQTIQVSGVNNGTGSFSDIWVVLIQTS